MYSGVITSSFLAQFEICHLIFHTVGRYHTFNDVSHSELIEDDRLCGNWWLWGKLQSTSTHTHTHTQKHTHTHTNTHSRLSEILVAQQGGCRESWSILLCLQKMPAGQSWTALKSHVCELWVFFVFSYSVQWQYRDEYSVLYTVYCCLSNVWLKQVFY